MNGYAYLCLYVLEARRAHEGEADDKDWGLRVGEWAETVIILLSCGIPQLKGNAPTIDNNVCGVVIEHYAKFRYH
jgi:hypothetical protein